MMLPPASRGVGLLLVLSACHAPPAQVVRICGPDGQCTAHVLLPREPVQVTKEQRVLSARNEAGAPVVVVITPRPSERQER
ncbi:MAG: hypothetical protein AB2A00_26960 [Myxococcota bacterium]